MNQAQFLQTLCKDRQAIFTHLNTLLIDAVYHATAYPHFGTEKEEFPANSWAYRSDFEKSTMGITNETALDLLSNDPGQLKEVLLKKTETVLARKPKERYTELLRNMRGLRLYSDIPADFRKWPKHVPEIDRDDFSGSFATLMRWASALIFKYGHYHLLCQTDFRKHSSEVKDFVITAARFGDNLLQVAADLLGHWGNGQYKESHEKRRIRKGNRNKSKIKWEDKIRKARTEDQKRNIGSVGGLEEYNDSMLEYFANPKKHLPQDLHDKWTEISGRSKETVRRAVRRISKEILEEREKQRKLI